MEINEAIEHCREKAVGCSECAKDHGQLAEWLEELQNYRDTGLTPSMVRSLIKREKESHKRAVERAIQLDELQERIRWIPVEERLPENPDEIVLVQVSGRPAKNIGLIDACQLAQYDPEEGWILEMYPYWEDAHPVAWMTLPEGYKAK